MGEEACLHILCGTYSGLAPLIHVSVLLSCDFHVSILFILSFTQVAYVHNFFTKCNTHKSLMHPFEDKSDIGPLHDSLNL